MRSRITNHEARMTGKKQKAHQGRSVIHNSKFKIRNQSGFVSLFSVLFFALLALVITIGFIRITSVEQQQALNNDLTARALSAAEAGVEDGKRAIAHYASLSGSARDTFRSALNTDNCRGLFGGPVQAALKLNDGRIGDTSQNLSYTCLTVDINTPNYLKTIAAGESHVIPLRGDGTFDNVVFEWHLNSANGDASGDGIPSNYPLHTPTVDLPTVSGFGADGAQPPAYIRAQLIGIKKTGTTSRGDLENRSRTLFLAPSDRTGGVQQLSFQTADDRGFNKAKSSPVRVTCDKESTASASIGAYACKFKFIMPAGDLSSTGNDYYLQITPLYADTHVKAQLFQGSALRNFDAVQPSIDSTGKAADVYRRIEARTNFPGAKYSMPRFAAEVGDNICKQFQITNDTAHFINPASGISGCNTPSGPPPPPPPPPTACVSKNDMILTLDESFSMRLDWQTGTRIAKLKQVAQRFVEGVEVSDAGNRVGIVAFSTDVTGRQQLTTNVGTLNNFISDLSPTAETNFTKPLDASRQELTGPASRSESPKVMIFISDGFPSDKGGDTSESLTRAVREVRDAGIKVYTIGITDEGNTANGADLLSDMAVNGGRYVSALNESQLTKVIDDLVVELSCE